MDVIVILACYYFAFTEIKSLVDYGAAPWRIEHYILAAISLALLVLGTLRAIQSYKTWKHKKDHPEEEMMSQMQSFQQEEDDTTPTLQEPDEDLKDEESTIDSEADETVDDEKPL